MNRYTFHDPIFDTDLVNQHLKVSSNTYILNIFRIISGTINITDNYTSKKYKLRKNFLIFPTKTNGKLSKNTILANFEDIKLNELNAFFQKTRLNIKFYKNLEIEIIKCVVAFQDCNHLEAFFYLYRIIEGMAYSVPLIYISKKTDYNKTYSILQKLFENKDGELRFFKNFIEETFRTEDYFNSHIDIDLSNINPPEIREKYFNIYISKILKPENIKSKTDYNLISITYLGFYDFIIELRNRFFHNLKGSWQENLESTELLYPDLFFAPLIEHGINWISLILFEIIKNDLSKSEN